MRHNATGHTVTISLMLAQQPRGDWIRDAGARGVQHGYANTVKSSLSGKNIKILHLLRQRAEKCCMPSLLTSVLRANCEEGKPKDLPTETARSPTPQCGGEGDLCAPWPLFLLPSPFLPAAHLQDCFCLSSSVPRTPAGPPSGENAAGRKKPSHGGVQGCGWCRRGTGGGRVAVYTEPSGLETQSRATVPPCTGNCWLWLNGLDARAGLRSHWKLWLSASLMARGVSRDRNSLLQNPHGSCTCYSLCSTGMALPR